MINLICGRCNTMRLALYSREPGAACSKTAEFQKSALAILSVILLMITSPALAQSLDQFSTHTPAGEAAGNDPDHGAFGAFLQTYLVKSEDGINRVRYGEVTSEDAAALASYIETLSAIDPTSLTQAQAFAYWVNFYNSLTVKVILDHYPVGSIRDIRTGLRAGPWRRKLVTVNGVALTLDDIEHNILRKFWSEPRVHYAVNCASIGCPNLSDTPFTAENTETLLDAGAKAYVNHPRGVFVTADGSVKLSSIYKWFRKDFGRNEDEVIDHLVPFAEPELAEALTQAKTRDGRAISGYGYDWSLNE